MGEKNQPRDKLFTFKVSQEEREAIDILADSLRRSAGDAIRITVMDAVKKLTKDTTKATPCE